MALRTIRRFGDDILRKKSKPVRDIDEKIITLLEDMRETMVKYNGLGLSAPQVGVLKRVAVIDTGYHDMEGEDGGASSSPSDEYYELINPEIIETEGEQTHTEGCLSLPGKSAQVRRPSRVVVRALNRHGEEYTVEGTETLAIALCHELDHLDGVLYTDKSEQGTLEDDSDEYDSDEYDE